MLVLTPDELRRSDAHSVASLASRSGCAIAVGTGELRGYAAAAALYSDWLVLTAGAVLEIDSPAAWSGAIRRIGRAALRLHLLDGTRFTAAEALRNGLCDLVVRPEEDPLKWVAGWIGGRSTVALDSAAALIRARGGDPLERAEFARLFAAGEPQEGLNAFLTRRQPNFGCEVTEFRGDASTPRDPGTAKPETS